MDSVPILALALPLMLLLMLCVNGPLATIYQTPPDKVKEHKPLSSLYLNANADCERSPTVCTLQYLHKAYLHFFLAVLGLLESGAGDNSPIGDRMFPTKRAILCW